MIVEAVESTSRDGNKHNGEDGLHLLRQLVVRLNGLTDKIATFLHHND
jgi:hypothetical protein